MAWTSYDSSGKALEKALSDVPVGAIIGFAGSSAPTGWLLCDGSAVSRTSYADLFAAIGTGYGAGNGTTTFNLPDASGFIVCAFSTSAKFARSGSTAGGDLTGSYPNPTIASGAAPSITSLTLSETTTSALTLTASGAGITIGDTGSVNLYRSASNVLKTDDDFHASKITANGGNVYWYSPANTATPFRISTLGNAWYFVCDSDANNASATNMFFDLAPANSVPVRFMSIGGTARKLNFHNSTGTSDNANLYHTADASTLKSDGNLEVAGTLKVGGNTIQAGTWTNYTPTWTSSGTAPSLGNGVIAGRYVVLGKTMLFTVNLAPGSTTTFGTGNYYFSSPQTMVNQLTSQLPIGTGIATDAANSVGYTMNVVQLNTTTFALRQATDTTNLFTATSPFGFGNGDSIRFSGMIEIA